jgi:DNA topoisomerase-1
LRGHSGTSAGIVCLVQTQSKRSQKSSATAVSQHPDPALAAREAGLRYTNDRQPGIHRKGAAVHGSAPRFRYVDAAGHAVRDEETLARIKALVIPPAWTEVWICAQANGHLQCTGRDAKGRKQSRYHAKWRASRDETKYERMVAFADALPKIRRHLSHDLALAAMPRAKVLATIVKLMEETLIRVGNEEYARTNKSYGLTTLRNRHVEVHGAEITFEFQGKSRVHHAISVEDPKLAKIIRQCSHIPGYELFQYIDSNGEHHALHSGDVNEYLQQITGEHFTAKDFRTWAGSVLACSLLGEFEPFRSETQAKKNIVDAVKRVAEKLGNTPSVCRKCYIHPTVLTSYLATKNEATKQRVKKAIRKQKTALHEEERRFLDLLAHQTTVL